MTSPEPNYREGLGGVVIRGIERSYDSKGIESSEFINVAVTSSPQGPGTMGFDASELYGAKGTDGDDYKLSGNSGGIGFVKKDNDQEHGEPFAYSLYIKDSI